MAETGGDETRNSSRMQPGCPARRRRPEPAGQARMDAAGRIGQTSREFPEEEPHAHAPAPPVDRFLLLGVAALPSLHAQNAGSPYSVTVPVTDTTDAQRDQAFATALGQVMTRVAGGQDLRGNPGYAEALGSASSLVQKFQYQRAATGLVLEVDFAPSSVRRLVAKLGVASAGIKPPVLLLVQRADGSLADQAALASLATTAGARGTNVVYPTPSSRFDAAKVAAADPAAL